VRCGKPKLVRGRISRLLALDVLTERFDRIEGFDLASYWQTYLERSTPAAIRARRLSASPRTP
jgi:hypothetical protein